MRFIGPGKTLSGYWAKVWPKLAIHAITILVDWAMLSGAPIVETENAGRGIDRCRERL